MKRSLWAIALLLPIFAQCAYADSITMFVAQANIRFVANCCGSDKQGSTFTGPGVNLSAFRGCKLLLVWRSNGLSGSRLFANPECW